MKYIVILVFRDDTVCKYECWDHPYVADWITLYMNDEPRTRKIFPKEAIKNIEYYVKA